MALCLMIKVLGSGQITKWILEIIKTKSHRYLLCSTDIFEFVDNRKLITVTFSLIFRISQQKSPSRIS